ncbi:ribbon-helix-helix domain-containing protein [Clostridium butyricum]
MKKKIAITIDEEIYAQLEILSNEEDRTISGQINKILKDYFKESK